MLLIFRLAQFADSALMKKTDTDMQNTVITVSSIDAEYYAIYPQVTRALPYQQLMQHRVN